MTAFFGTAPCMFWRLSSFYCESRNLSVCVSRHLFCIRHRWSSQPNDSCFRILPSILCKHEHGFSGFVTFRIKNSLFHIQLICVYHCPLCDEYLMLCKKPNYFHASLVFLVCIPLPVTWMHLPLWTLLGQYEDKSYTSWENTSEENLKLVIGTGVTNEKYITRVPDVVL